MPSRFTYHPDNSIYRNGEYVSSFADFADLHPELALVEGQFFTLFDDGSLELIAANGNHSTPQNPLEYESLIIAITNLE